MKRNRLNPPPPPPLGGGGSATIAFAVAGISIPGCEALLRDPQAFFAENTCSIFNCDTLLFLDGGQGEMPDDLNDLGPDITNQ